jgi:hypothetical protein
MPILTFIVLFLEKDGEGVLVGDKGLISRVYFSTEPIVS